MSSHRTAERHRGRFAGAAALSLLAALSALGACSTSRRGASPLSGSGGGKHLPAAFSRAPRTCAATAAQYAPQSVTFNAHASLGAHDGVTWLWGAGAAGRSTVARLAADGSLQQIAAPRVATTSVARVGRDRLLLVRTGQINPTKPLFFRFAALRGVGAAARFVAGPSRTVRGLAPRYIVDAVASDGARILMHAPTLAPKGRHYARLFDGKTGAAVGPLVDVGKLFERKAIWCARRRGCSLVGVVGDGRTRRLIALSFDPRGRVTRRALSSEHTLEVSVVRLRSRLLIAWTVSGDNAVRVRALSLDGAPRGPVMRDASAKVAGVSVYSIHLAGERLGQRAWLAVKPHYKPWQLRALRVGPAGVAPVRAGLTPTLPSNLSAIRSAWLGNHALLALLSANVAVSGGRFRFHSWIFRGRVVAMGRSASGHARVSAAIPLGSRSGDGRGGFRVHVLTRRGRASVLLSASGSAPGRGQLIAVRVPCAR